MKSEPLWSIFISLSKTGTEITLNESKGGEAACDGTNLGCTWSLQAASGGTIGWRVEDVCGAPFKTMCEPTHSDLPTGDPISRDCCQCQVPTAPTVMRARSNVPFFHLHCWARPKLPASHTFPLKLMGGIIWQGPCFQLHVNILERCASDGLVWFIQVFLTECFNCRLT